MKTFPMGHGLPKRKTAIAVAFAFQAFALSYGAAAQTVTVDSTAGDATGTVSGNETNVVYSGSPAAPAIAAVTMVQNASLGGQAGVAVSSTATNTDTQLALSGGNTINGSVSGVNEINVGGHTDSSINGSVQSVGTLTLDTTSHLLLGGSTSVNQVNFDQGATVGVSSSLQASTIDFRNVAGTIDVASGGTLAGTVQSSGGSNGTVVFERGGSASGALGTTAAKLGSVQVGVAGAGTLTMQGGVAAQSLAIENGSTVNVSNGSVTAGTSLAGGATLSVSNGNVAGNVTTTANGTGTLTLGGGTQTVAGNVGASGAALAAVNAGASGSTTTFTGAVNAVNTNVGAGTASFAGLTTGTLGFTGAGTANLGAGLTGNVDFENEAATVNVANGQTLDGTVQSTGGVNGTLAFAQNGTVTGDVGTSGASISALNVGTAAQGTVTAQGNVYANTVSLQNDSTLSLSANQNLTGNVTTTADGTGALSLSGGTQTVSGDVGASGASLGALNVGTASQGTVTAQGDVYANTVSLQNGSALTLVAGKNLTGSVTTAADGTGTLTLAGGAQALTGSVGASGASLGALNVGTVSQGTVTAQGDIYADTVSLQNGSTLSVSNGDVAGNVTTAADGTGTLTLAGGTQTVSGDVGASGAALAAVNAGASGSTTTFTGAVNAVNTTVGAGTANFAGLTTGTLGFSDAGTANLGAGMTGNVDFANQAATVNVANGQTLDGTVQSTGGVNGTLAFAQNGTVTGDVGTSGTSISALNVGTAAQGTVTAQGNVYANTVSLQNDSTLSLSANQNLTGNVTTAADGTGTLTLAGGTQTVAGDVGASGAALAAVNAGASGSTTTFTGAVNAVNTTVGAGTANFASLTTGTLGFSDAGTANLGAGVTGNVDFANQAATVNVANGQTLDGTVQSTGGVNGTLAFAQNGTVTGDVGTSGASIATLNVGTAAQGTVTAQGNVYANTVSVQNDSTLSLAANKNLTGNVTTAADGTGTLTLAGGTQTVAGNVGASGAALAAVNAGAAGATTTFTGAVNAVNTNVGAGTASFAGLTTGTLGFTGAGTANLGAGMTGNVDFANQAATVNVAHGQTLDGTVQSTGGVNGTLAFAQNGTVTGDVGTSGTSISALNVGTAAQGTVTAQGNVYANTVSLQNDSTLSLAANRNLTGNVTTTADGTGALLLSGGTQTVSGDVGASGAALAAVNAGAADATTTFTGAVNANQILAGGNGSVTTFDGATTGAVQFAGNGSVVLNGPAALKGTVDFSGNAGALHIGDGVNVAFDAAHLNLQNAGSATLAFDGSSTVTTSIGSAGNGVVNNSPAPGAGSGSVPGAIDAGADGKVVTFTNTVAVGSGNLNVSGTGEVVLQRGLDGGLNFAADGTAIVADARQISGAVSASAAGTGTLDFAGSSSTAAAIGSAAAPLKAIDFNTSGQQATASLNNDLYADTISVGANTAATVTSNLAFGGNLSLAAASSSLDLQTSTLSGVAGASGFDLGSGTLKTTIDGATFGAVHANAFSNASDAHVAVTVLPSNTAVQNGETFEIGGAAAGNTGARTLDAGNVSTNSAALSFTAEAGSSGGAVLGADSGSAGQSLYLVAHRNDYASAAGLAGSQPGASAASALSALALDPAALAASGLTGVVGHLDAETASQLHADAQRLAPLTNSSLTQTAFLASDAALGSIASRQAALRDDPAAGNGPTAGALGIGADPGRYSVWVKGYGAKSSQSAEDGYAGYNATTGGIAVGADARWAQGGAGIALSQGISSIDENDALSGDTAQVKSYQLTAYATQAFGRAYVDGLIGVARERFGTTRVSALDQVANANFNGMEGVFRLSGGYPIPLASSVLLTPIVAIEGDVLHQDGYTESGAGPLDLNVESKNSARVRLSFGGKLSGETGTAIRVRPELHAFVNQDFGNESDGTNASYVGGGAWFFTPGYHVSRTSVTVGGGLSLDLTRMIQLQVQADVEARSGYDAVFGGIVARGRF
ncbi:hypothetical protein [Paraburkholderia lycopersici]|uniref:Uncharacterized conserved protein, contains a C-terminal beta-barrel porin domain n=1 Tax=Paraburkholderia lycopersici TaxID=416944 RepID=A0A1G6HFU6_9BURK|nr:hypothetical protein [Paraburkholderia lycopersici]SDB92795.1 Uncharacterized conserved protein, contains a C-terminal beta-barrel porin domain [Paraburkholderia lycopersici]